MSDDVTRLLARAGVTDFEYRDDRREPVGARISFPLTEAIAEMLAESGTTTVRKLSAVHPFLVTERGGERPGREPPEPSIINDFLSALGRTRP